MIIAIDGPSASGKGTLGRRLAARFDYPYLDTGLIYRALAKLVLDRGISIEETDQIAACAKALTIDDLNKEGLRTEEISGMASKVAALRDVRRALYEFQRNFALFPPNGKKGAVLDGRDIGTTICPDADVKLFITATLEARAERRYKELQNSDTSVIYSAVLEDMRRRDLRDSSRDTAPLKPAEDAVIIDTSDMAADAVFDFILKIIKDKTSG